MQHNFGPMAEIHQTIKQLFISIIGLTLNWWRWYSVALTVTWGLRDHLTFGSPIWCHIYFKHKKILNLALCSLHGIYEGHPESKDRLAIKKNKQTKNKKNLMYHYYRP
jgi:hypothetical protein